MVVSGKHLNVLTDITDVKAGQRFSVDISFDESVPSNEAVIAYMYDRDAFDYMGFISADGVSLINTVIKDGVTFLTVTSGGYNTLEYGQAQFCAKKAATLTNDFSAVDVCVQYVYSDAAFFEKNVYAFGSTSVFTGRNPFTPSDSE